MQTLEIKRGSIVLWVSDSILLTYYFNSRQLLQALIWKWIPHADFPDENTWEVAWHMAGESDFPLSHCLKRYFSDYNCPFVTLKFKKNFNMKGSVLFSLSLRCSGRVGWRALWVVPLKLLRKHSPTTLIVTIFGIQSLVQKKMLAPHTQSTEQLYTNPIAYPETWKT